MERLNAAVLDFDLTSEAEQLRREEPWLKTGHNAKTLVKYPDLRIVLAVLKAGNRMHEHQAEGSISIHPLRGSLRLHLKERTIDLQAGHLLALNRSQRHDVEALKDSVFLLSISWNEGGKNKRGFGDNKEFCDECGVNEKDLGIVD